ncbi:MAG: glycosyltransferase family 2 protein [Candidatus Margulisbacteria bacterium]|nr:glycosyltransferase family 2 protein [Candidatus Margulisiibacteriota bacterium]
MKLSIIIPCYNEAVTIKQVIFRVLASDTTYFEKEIIVVDDASTDITYQLLEDFPNIKLIRHTDNQGKGAAINTGLKAATGDVLLIQDADLEYDPNDYAALLLPIQQGRTNVVYGSRFLHKKPYKGLYFWHAAGNRILTLLSNFYTGQSLTDMETCYKVFTVSVYKLLNIQEKKFGVEPEITAKLARLMLPIIEVPISYNARSFEEGKKIGWRDGLRAMWCIIYYNKFAKII